MAKYNYKQIYAIKKQREDKIKKACPDITYNSGIYVFYRKDEIGLNYCYVGQAVKLCERCASHLSEYDHIALSLKKHGFQYEGNPYGWQLRFKECPKDELDDREREVILKYASNGYQLYNRTSGGQDNQKVVIGEGKSPKNYHDGLKQGRKSLAKELKNIADKHLNISIKEEKKNNKISIKQFEKFNHLLSGEEE